MLKVNLLAARGFAESEKAKLLEAIKYLEKQINTPWFKNEIIFSLFTSTTLDNYSIYNLIMSGKEVLQPEVDNEIDVDITIYNTWPWVGTIGYTYPDTIRTWINRKYFKQFSVADIAANIAHEYCHKLGFTHPFYDSEERRSSVPYVVGDLISQQSTRYPHNFLVQLIKIAQKFLS